MRPDFRVGALVIVCLFAFGANAQSLEVAPVSIELPAGQLATTLSITNRGEQKTPLQIRPFVWTQTSGADGLIATNNLVVSPPISELQPGVLQTIRLVLREPPAVSTEQAFRLLIDQLPGPGAPGSARVALRLSIPVFVEPAVPVVPSLKWTLASSGGRVLELLASNLGGRRTKIIDPVLITPAGVRLNAGVPVNPYVLPGATRSWRINGWLPAGNRAHLTVETDSGRVEQDLSVVNAP